MHSRWICDSVKFGPVNAGCPVVVVLKPDLPHGERQYMLIRTDDETLKETFVEGMHVTLTLGVRDESDDQS